MGIYVFDIDGTISSHGKKVSSLISNTLVELAQNHQVIFASARPVRDMLPMLPDFLHDSIFIGCNGGMAWQNGKIILSHHLSSDFVSHLLAQLNSLKIPYVLDGDWHFAFSKHTHPFQEYIRTLSHHETSEDDIITKGVTKILILKEDNKDTILSSLKDNDISIHTHKHDGFYDITPQGNNKFRTLTHLIGDEKYIAFGNDQNDFIMLDNAEISVFIGNQADYQNASYYRSIDEIAAIIPLLSLADNGLSSC